MVLPLLIWGLRWKTPGSPLAETAFPSVAFEIGERLLLELAPPLLSCCEEWKTRFLTRGPICWGLGETGESFVTGNDGNRFRDWVLFPSMAFRRTLLGGLGDGRAEPRSRDWRPMPAASPGRLTGGTQDPAASPSTSSETVSGGCRNEKSQRLAFELQGLVAANGPSPYRPAGPQEGQGGRRCPGDPRVAKELRRGGPVLWLAAEALLEKVDHLGVVAKLCGNLERLWTEIGAQISEPAD